MNRFIKWHNSQIDWWKEKLNVSWYAVSWISFIKGALLVLIIVALTGCSIGGEKKIKIFSVEQPREKIKLSYAHTITNGRDLLAHYHK